jgi:glycerophosphoryl diester phosphodiesterase
MDVGSDRHIELVMTWPVNDHATLDSVLALGVTGVISDEPGILAEVVARR